MDEKVKIAEQNVPGLKAPIGYKRFLLSQRSFHRSSLTGLILFIAIGFFLILSSSLIKSFLMTVLLFIIAEIYLIINYHLIYRLNKKYNEFDESISFTAWRFITLISFGVYNGIIALSIIMPLISRPVSLGI